MNYSFLGLNITNLLKVTSLPIRNLENFESGHHNLYPFTLSIYPKNMHFLALDSNLPSFT